MKIEVTLKIEKLQTIVILTVVLVSGLCKCKNIESDSEDERFYPSQNDEDYNFPIYPFQQYIQVRRTYTVEHLPRQESGSSVDSSNKHESKAKKGDSLVKSGSDHHEHSHSNNQGGYEDDEKPYYKPPLREEISTKKKQEVYEERGYSDGHYDHASHGEKAVEHEYHPHYAQSSSSHHPQPAHSHRVKNYRNRKETRPRHRKPRPVGVDEASSTRVLKHIADNLHDKDAQAVGFYQARSHIYCPEVIDFDLSSKSQGMGQGPRPKGKRRLNGLGAKIDCLKNKYFTSGSASELLPSTVFLDPEESRHSTIKMGSMSDFMAEIKKYLT